MSTPAPFARHFNDVTTRVGEKLNKFARRMDESVESTATAPESAGQTDAQPTAHAAATLSNLGDYLRDADYEKITEELQRIIKDNPRSAVLLSVGTGFVLGATLGRGTFLRFLVPTLITPMVKRGWANATAATAASDVAAAADLGMN